MNTQTTTAQPIANLTSGTLATSYGGGMYGSPEIVSFGVTDDGLHVIKRARPNFTYAVCGPNSTPPDQVWKETWLIVDGKLVKQPDVYGKHQRAYQVPESIEFPDAPKE